MKLAFKVPLILFLISAVSTVAVFILIFFSMRSTLEDADAERQLLLAGQIMDKVDLFMNERFNDVQSIATRSRVMDVLNQKNDNTDKERVTESFRRLTKLYFAWKDISIIDLNGKEIVSTEDKLSNNIIEEDPIYKDLFQKAVSGQQVYSDVYFSSELNAPSMVFFMPVFSDSSKTKIIGVAEAHLEWGAIQNLLEGQIDPLVHLYDKQGFVIATSDFGQRDNVLKEDNSKSAIFQQALANDRSAVLPGTHGGTVLVSHVHEKGHENFKGNGWIITLETPVGIAFAPAIRDALSVGLISIPLVLFATALALLILNSLVLRPVNKLMDATKEIAAGNLEKRVDIYTKDEFGNLATAFNGMAVSLQDMYMNLENKVKEKTVDLEKKIEEADTANKATLNVLEDLSEEKENVEESRARDEAILSNIGDGLIAVNEKGNIQIINTAAQQMLGINEREAIGKHFSEILQLEDQKGVPVPLPKRPLSLALQGKATAIPMAGSYSLIRKDKSKFAAWDFASPVFLNHKITGAVVVFRDVTKEKEVDRMKTEFISLASHQLRTPLSAIKWFVELLMETKLDSEQKDFGNNIAISTERMIELVNSLLDVSRIESGRIIVAPVPTDLSLLLKDVLKDIQQKINERKQKLDIKIAPSLPKINIDPSLISQIYMNLLTNAIKYTPKEGNISVSINVSGKDVVSEIKDSGMGIPVADQKKVFTKFYRSAEAIKAEPNGNGLGLYLAKAIVEASGGKIWFESTPGKGTSFWISLPLAGSKPKSGEVHLTAG